jgi:flagellar motor switch protein FliM
VQVSVGADVGPALSQDEIDGLLQQARNGDA